MKPPGRRCRRRHWALPAMILACAPPGHALAQPPDSVAADPAPDAYLDETAQRLVLGARHARDTARLAKLEMDLAPWEGRHWLPRSVRWDGHMAWEIVSATAFVPPGVPFAVDWALAIEDVRAPGEGPAVLPADPAAPADGSVLPPSIWRDSPSIWRDNPAVSAELAAIGTGQGGDHGELRRPGNSAGRVTSSGPPIHGGHTRSFATIGSLLASGRVRGLGVGRGRGLLRGRGGARLHGRIAALRPGERARLWPGRSVASRVEIPPPRIHLLLTPRPAIW